MAGESKDAKALVNTLNSLTRSVNDLTRIIKDATKKPLSQPLKFPQRDDSEDSSQNPDSPTQTFIN